MRRRNKKKEMSFLEHVEEFRGHLIRSILSVLIFAIAAFAFRGIIFDTIIFAPKTPDFITNRLMCEFGQNIAGSDILCINRTHFDIINIKLAGQFVTHISISLIAGLLIAFPYVFYEFWRFIKPALNKNELSKSRGTVFFTSILFTVGALFGYFIIVPLSVHFLGSYSVSEQVNNQIALSSYIQTLTSIVLASGVIFELPVLIFFLSKVGLVTPDFLKKYRRHSVIVVLILSAIITPPDIFSQILVALPLMVLYEAGIVISKRIQKKEEAEYIS